MDTITKLQQHLDSILGYLTPLLPLANCHMVEFFTQNHWENLLPSPLRIVLDKWDLDTAVDMFWRSAVDDNDDDNELTKWIREARSHCVQVNNEYCLSKEQLEFRIRAWGGDIDPGIRVTEFMSSKKSYEVQSMCSVVASLFTLSGATHCVEAGGGRGALPLALALGHRLPSLTLDCDATTIATAKKRVKIIQKQWHTIAKRANGAESQPVDCSNHNLHRFAVSYVTSRTDVGALVEEAFPEHCDRDVKLLLTGLHTCGNLGPDSLRIFTTRPSTAALVNVPCCYHLLTERVDASLFDVFQRDFGHGENAGEGFPMSERLRGFNLGRNARMLAAQSIDRVVHHREMPSKSLLYRALLQAIIKKHAPNFVLPEGKLKRMVPKCQNFTDYLKLADEVLKLGLFDTLPTNYLEDVHKDVDSRWREIVLFYFIRLCLAQVVESVILLDRLLFLYENGCNKVFLVKLFNPVLSPRCHSIVAIR